MKSRALNESYSGSRHTRSVGRLRCSFGLGLILLLAGCGVSQTRVIPVEELPFPVLDASRSELIEGLEEISRSISTLRATVNITATVGALTTGEETTYRETQGFIVVERPSRIRMRGVAPLALVTVFDMWSDGETFQVNVPIQNRVFIGDTSGTTQAENAILNLRPQHIMDSLFVDIDPFVDSSNVLPVLYEEVDGRRSFYVFEFIDSGREDPEVLERIWIDRRDLRVSRKQVFGAKGIRETDVSYEFYQELEGAIFPRRIMIERPVEDYSLEINFESTELNVALDESVFMRSAPAGSELVDLDEPESDQLD